MCVGRGIVVLDTFLATKSYGRRPEPGYLVIVREPLI